MLLIRCSNLSNLILSLTVRDLDQNEIAFIEDGTFAGILQFERL